MVVTGMCLVLIICLETSSINARKVGICIWIIFCLDTFMMDFQSFCQMHLIIFSYFEFNRALEQY